MNTTESTNAAKEVASRLMILSADLLDDKFISNSDLAAQINRLANRLIDSNAEKQSGGVAESVATPTTDAERLKRYHTVRYTGIEFKRYFSPHFVRLVGSFVNPAGDKNQNHVYELLVKASESRPGRWIAKGTNDGRELFTLTCASKWGAERYGFGALRSYLLRNLRKTIKANKAKEGK